MRSVLILGPGDCIQERELPELSNCEPVGRAAPESCGSLVVSFRFASPNPFCKRPVPFSFSVDGRDGERSNNRKKGRAADNV